MPGGEGQPQRKTGRDGLSPGLAFPRRSDRGEGAGSPARFTGPTDDSGRREKISLPPRSQETKCIKPTCRCREGSSGVAFQGALAALGRLGPAASPGGKKQLLPEQRLGVYDARAPAAGRASSERSSEAGRAGEEGVHPSSQVQGSRPPTPSVKCSGSHSSRSSPPPL